MIEQFFPISLNYFIYFLESFIFFFQILLTWPKRKLSLFKGHPPLSNKKKFYIIVASPRTIAQNVTHSFIIKIEFKVFYFFSFWLDCQKHRLVLQVTVKS